MRFIAGCIPPVSNPNAYLSAISVHVRPKRVRERIWYVESKRRDATPGASEDEPMVGGLQDDPDEDEYTNEEQAAGTNPNYKYSHPYTDDYRVGYCSKRPDHRQPKDKTTRMTLFPITTGATSRAM